MYLHLSCVLVSYYIINVVNSFHNKLKTTYLDGKVNRRVDYLLDTLIRMERDQFFGYNYKTQMLQANPRDNSETQWHERGLNIPITAVKVIHKNNLLTYLNIGNTYMYIQASDDGSWQVDSMSRVKSGGYIVTKVADKCAENCFGLTCTKAECGQLCMHMYTCDKACYDFNNGHICIVCTP